MFKEGRRCVSVYGVSRAAGRLSALAGVWLFACLTQLEADDPPVEAPGPDDVAIATDMDEPAQFVPHEEQALDLDLDFAAENPFQGDATSPLTTTEPPSEPSVADSRRPHSDDGEANLLRQPRLLSDPQADAKPAERDEAQGTMHRAYELAKAAAVSADYAAVIDLCEDGEASTNWEAGQKYFRQLASWAHNRRGEAYVRQGRAADALTDFDSALKLDPQNWRAAHNRGVSRAEKGELATAVADFSHVISLQEDYGPAYRNRGEVLFATGQFAKAIEDYTRALTYMPESDELYYLRASALHRLGRCREALADYDASLRGETTAADRYIGRAGVHAELSDFASAIADLDKAIKLAPQSAEAYRAVAWILATCPNPQYRRPDKALLAARHALELQGNTDPVYFDTLAAAFAAAEEFEQAVTIQDYAIRLASGREEKEALRARLALYNQNRPYVIGTSAGSSEADEPKSASAGGRSARASGLRQPQRLATPAQ